MPEITKTCTTCACVLPLSAFRKEHRVADGKSASCKKCHASHMKYYMRSYRRKGKPLSELEIMNVIDDALIGRDLSVCKTFETINRITDFVERLLRDSA